MAKILFANPPVVRSEFSSPDNDFKVDGFVMPRWLADMRKGWRWYWRLRSRFGLGKGIRYGVRAGSRWPWTLDCPMRDPVPYPFFMGYAASNLRHNGFESTVFDALAMRETNYGKFLKTLQREKADILVLECSTPTLDIDTWFASRAAAFTEVALAGPHLATHCEEVMAQCPDVRYFLKGEYVLNSLEMAQTRRPGIYESVLVEDLDSIPFPIRDFEGASRYFEPTMPTPRPQLQIYGSKGCPFKCSFCVWPQAMYGGKVSLRSPAAIAEEIHQNVRQGGYKSILFDDDTFNIGTERVSEICDKLKSIALPWTMMGRLDCSPDWLFDKMVDSGCVGMRFGIETFNIDVLKRIHKGLERHDFRSTLERLSAKYPEIYLHVTMMRDMPGQTQEIHAEDMRILAAMGFSTSAKKRTYQLSRCAPFPGTRLYEELKGEGYSLDEDFRLYDGSLPTVMNKDGETNEK